MQCPSCKELQKKHELLDNAITNHDEPLLLLHSLVAIMRPNRAAKADAFIKEESNLKNVLKEKK